MKSALEIAQIRWTKFQSCKHYTVNDSICLTCCEPLYMTLDEMIRQSELDYLKNISQSYELQT